MGKLKEIIQEMLTTPTGSPKYNELLSEFNRIADWMVEQGYCTPDKKPQPPNKKVNKWFILKKQELEKCPKCTGQYGYFRKDHPEKLQQHLLTNIHYGKGEECVN